MTASPRLLDLFCCEGGAATGYHRAGFDVLGVDIVPRPRYPFPFVQADAIAYLGALTFLELAQFQALHASPPCQKWASGTHDREAWPDLIQPIRELFERSGAVIGEAFIPFHWMPLPGFEDDLATVAQDAGQFAGPTTSSETGG